MHRIFQSLFFGTVLTTALVAGGNVQERQDTQRPPDNTRVNREQQPTADQAKENVSDREMTKRIRRDVVADRSLSTYGHNVKIVVQHGKVTLRGPVHSDDEKRAIEEHARRHAGEGNVDNRIEVKEDHRGDHNH